MSSAPPSAAPVRLPASCTGTPCQDSRSPARKLQKASSAYPSRTFGKAQQTRHLALELLAQKRQKELEKRGIRSELLREEPFTTAQDSIEFKVHLMIWEKGVWNRKARIETWEDK